MKRTIYVPEMLANIQATNRDQYAKQLRAVGADFLFIAPERSYMFESETVQDAAIETIKEHLQYFRSQGFGCGLWIQAFGFGNPLSKKEKEVSKDMTKILSVTGNQAGDAFCPEDEAYMKPYCAWVSKLATTKPDRLMLDDDLCLSVRPGLGCFCDRHIEILEEKIGRKLLHSETGRGLAKSEIDAFFTGKGNELRRAYLNVMGETLKTFCRKVRAAVDAVDETIRAGFCAGYTSWDIEGVDAIELTKILAGKNPPFFRFTGAPYWVAPHWNRFPGQRLHGVIEFAREQEYWCQGADVEYFTEADSYPRPRYHIPANLIEGFDAAMAASNHTQVLKYFFDYFSTPNYETGYVRAHQKNQSLYDFIHRHFSKKAAAGVKVYEAMKKFSDMQLPKTFNEGKVMETALPHTAAMLTQLTIPVTYSGEAKCAAAFGENVKSVDNLHEYMILDLPAALLLQEQGIDVGIEAIEGVGKELWPATENTQEERISLSHPYGRFYESCKLREGATVLSFWETEEIRIPAVYRYDSKGIHYLVLMFDAYSVNQSSGLFCSYLRQQQILDFYSDFPVVKKCPFLYELYKKNDRETAIFFANLFEDEIWNFEIQLSETFRKMECINIEAELHGDRIKVKSVVPAYGMFAIKLS